MRRFCTLLTILASTALGYSQSASFSWHRSAGGNGYRETGHAVTTDASGNIYMTGRFDDEAVFGSGSNQVTLTPVNYSSDIFISKYDPSGTLVWVRQIGGPATDAGMDIRIDASGEVLVTGVFNGTVDFDPAPSASFELEAKGKRTGGMIGPPQNPTNVFIASYTSASGAFRWARQIQADQVYGMELDGTGQILLTGAFSDTGDFDPDPAAELLLYPVQFQENDIYVLKLDGAGGLVWARDLGGISNDQGRGIAVDRDNNIYISGIFRDTVDFDPAPGSSFKLVSARASGSIFTSGPFDVFILKLNVAGNFVWAGKIGGNGADEVHGLAVAPDGSRIFLGGTIPSEAEMSPYPQDTSVILRPETPSTDGFLLALDKDGKLDWVKGISSTHADQVKDLHLDASGFLYAAGNIGRQTEFETGQDKSYRIRPLSNLYYADMFLSKYHPSGELVWVRAYGGINPSEISPECITTDKDGSILITGQFQDRVTAHPGNYTDTLESRSSYDILLARFNQDSDCHSYESTIIEAYICDGGTSYTHEGITYTETGIHTFYHRTASGCDSIVTLDLRFGRHTTGPDIFEDACDSFTVLDQTYTTSGRYALRYTTPAGCDSVVQLELTIRHSTADTLRIISCLPSYEQEGRLYTSSGIYPLDTFTNAASCDSFHILDLTLLPSSNTVVRDGNTLRANADAHYYQWYDCDSRTMIGGAGGKEFTPVQSGNYAVIAGGDELCSDTSACILFEAPGLVSQERYEALSCTIYPNPAAGSVHVRTNRTLRDASMRITDISGRTYILHTALQGSDHAVDLNGLTPGIYILEVEANEQTVYRQLIKY